MQDIDKDQIALGVRQPWAELLMQGIKTIEVRSRPTNVRGPIYLYTSKTVANEQFAKNAIAQYAINIEDSLKGLLIGSVEISACRPCTIEDSEAACIPWETMQGKYAWEITNPIRFANPVAVRFLPYGIWFYPFKRRNESEQ